MTDIRTAALSRRLEAMSDEDTLVFFDGVKIHHCCEVGIARPN
jgi:hypothetical protein